MPEINTEVSMFVALWLRLRRDFDCMLESGVGLIIYIETDESEKDEIVKIMHDLGAGAYKLDWCDSNWTITQNPYKAA